jgi:hypothetical protein
METKNYTGIDIYKTNEKCCTEKGFNRFLRGGGAGLKNLFKKAERNMTRKLPIRNSAVIF